jgi:hypothetical protein
MEISVKNDDAPEELDLNKETPINQWIEELKGPFIPQTAMHNTAISKVTSFSLCTGHHQTYALVRTKKKHKIIHKRGKEILIPLL